MPGYFRFITLLGACALPHEQPRALCLTLIGACYVVAAVLTFAYMPPSTPPYLWLRHDHPALVPPRP